MDIRVQRFPKKNSDQSPIQSTSCFSVKGQPCWNSHEHQFPQSLSKNPSLKVESPSQVCRETKHLYLQLQDRDSSSTQSTGQSHHEVITMGGIDCQDQCISSDSVHEESHGKCIEGQINPLFLMANPNFVINPSQVDISQTMTRIPYNYADPYLSGLFTAYGPQAVVQPQVMGIAPGRLPLPLDLAEDGPIYVNAKQYHGILRRRQTRAKLEAQNKLVKNRRPYLHESRHLHALNRVRGSGGRFLSTKKQQKLCPSSSPHRSSNSSHFCQKGDISEFGIHQSETSASVTDNNVLFQHQERRFSGISPGIGVAMQGMCNGTWPRAPVVR